jgi:hypothetical protein
LDTVVYTYDYTGPGDSDNLRLSTAGGDSGNTELQEMFPPFNVGDVVWISAVDMSMVTVSTYGDIKWIEVNTAREWVKKYME